MPTKEELFVIGAALDQAKQKNLAISLSYTAYFTAVPKFEVTLATPRITHYYRATGDSWGQALQSVWTKWEQEQKA